MFKFNLLPPEKRRLRRTPLPYFIGIIVLIILASFAGIDLTLTIRHHHQLIKKKKNLADRKLQLSQQVLEYEKLLADKTSLENRLKYIQEVEAKKFIVWTRKLDEFLDILQRFPNAWVENISVAVGGGEEIEEHRGRKILAVLEIKMVINTLNPAEVITFREAIKNPENKLIVDFDYINPPGWTKELFQIAEGEPLKVFKFTIKLVKFQPKQ
ncbi:MAG: hypothetical protein ACK4NF_01830 [Planctomycetota bacterium]